MISSKIRSACPVAQGGPVHCRGHFSYRFFCLSKGAGEVSISRVLDRCTVGDKEWAAHKKQDGQVFKIRHLVKHLRNRVQSLKTISSVQSLSRVRLFATPRTVAHQASLSITNSRSLLKLMSIMSLYKLKPYPYTRQCIKLGT